MKKINSTVKILLSLVLGVVVGLILNKFVPSNINAGITTWILAPLGNLFLRAIKMVVIPLVLCSLIVGTASIGDIKKLGRIGGKTIVFYLSTTAFAVTIALILGNILKPGMGFTGNPMTIASGNVEAAKSPFIMDMITNIIPTNPVESLVKGDMLQIIFFAIVFGVAATLVGKKAKPVIDFFENVNNILLKIIDLIMKTAPIGVFALISQVIVSQGTTVLLSLIKYVLVVLVGLLIHTFVVYGGLLKLLGKVSPIKFFKKFWTVMLFAFSTSSSNATIPVNIETCNNKLGVADKISSFTIPLGATVNMDGTAIMQGVAVMFIAQIFGIDLTFNQQLMVILTSTLASIGTAGVPSAGVVMLTMVLQQVGLPIEGAALVLSVDRIVDMFRTTTNITGDAICTAIIAKSENDLDLDVFNSKDGKKEDLAVA